MVAPGGRETSPTRAIADRRTLPGVHLLFLDEAGTPGQPLFVLGGVAILADRWPKLRARWRELAGAGGRPPEAEVKWTNVKRNGHLASRLADVLVECGATAFLVELRTEEGLIAAPELFASPEDVYATALMFVAERFQRFLAHHDDYGAIILDQREGTQDERLRRFSRRLADDGTPFTGLDRIVDPVLLSPSHHTIGIQAADLVVGSALALGRAGAPDISRKRVELAGRLHERLLPCFARHPHTGEIEGVGIKRFPDPCREPVGKLFEVGAVGRLAVSGPGSAQLLFAI